MVEYETALCHDLMHRLETRCMQCLPLLRNRHVQGLILHTACAREMIAHQIGAAWRKQLADLAMKRYRMALMAQLVDSLIGDDALEGAETSSPVLFLKAPFQESGSDFKLAEASSRQAMHWGREV